MKEDQIELVETTEVAVVEKKDAEVIKTSLNADAIRQFSAMAAQLKDLEVSDINESAKILPFETAGESYRLLLVNVEPHEKVDESTGEVVERWNRYLFIDDASNLRYASNSGINKTLKDVEIPSAWQITYTGAETFPTPDGKKGMRKLFDIRRLFSKD